MQGTVVWYRSDDDCQRSCKMRVSKFGYIITRTKRHIKTTPITAEYLRNKGEKDKSLLEKRFDEPVDHYKKLYDSEMLKIINSNCGSIMNTPHIE